MDENYIVRIYRRDKHESDRTIGTVERVENSQKIAFRNPSELLKFLRLSRCPDERNGAKRP